MSRVQSAGTSSGTRVHSAEARGDARVRSAGTRGDTVLWGLRERVMKLEEDVQVKETETNKLTHQLNCLITLVKQ